MSAHSLKETDDNLHILYDPASLEEIENAARLVKNGSFGRTKSFEKESRMARFSFARWSNRSVQCRLFGI